MSWPKNARIGKKHSKKTKALMSLKKIGTHFRRDKFKENPKYYYQTLHAWLYSRLGKAKLCQNREKKFLKFKCTGKSMRFDWANKSQNYKRNLKDWLQLCRSCHIKYDR